MRPVRTLAANIYRKGLCAGYGAMRATGLYRCSAPPVSFITEGANWTIHWVGKSYVEGVEAHYPGTIGLTYKPYKLHDRVVHFGSQFFWRLWADFLPPSNKVVVTYFHGKHEDGPEMSLNIDYLLGNLDRVAHVVTASSLMERRLLDWGVAEDKLSRIPLGVDTALFRPPTEEERRTARARLGVPGGALCIGSFQKDGVGWGEGLEPKLIKGPDVFVEAAARLAKEFPVFVLLTGPARGYVMRGLEKRGVPYGHIFHKDYQRISTSYHALDLYLVTSREEGGPQALLESMASGVPLVSTRVGMAEDVIKDGVNGALVQVGHMEGLVNKSAELLSDSNMAEDFKAKGRAQAERYDWNSVALQLYDKVYKGLL